MDEITIEKDLYNTFNKNRRILTLNEIINDNSEPPPPIIGNGILLDKTLLMICGEKKVGKSMLIYNLALAIASGKSFACFKIAKAQRVLILSAEGGYYPNRDRVKKMCMFFNKTSSDNFRLINNPNIFINNSYDLQYLKSTIKENKIKVLVIDPFIKFHNVEENSANEMSGVLNNLRNLIEEENISVILVHHYGKNPNNGARGSSAISGEYDSLIQMTKSKDNIKLSFEMRHVETPEDESLAFNKNSMIFELDGVKCIFSELFSTPDCTQSKSALVTYIRDNKFCNSESGAYKMVKKYIQKGVLIDTGNKNFKLVYDSPFPKSTGE